ncbi:MAG: nitronate monooxygenase [Actinobacteria bacterium]|nr:nitronate monooxygenase [Actinomycetota bacterium]
MLALRTALTDLVGCRRPIQQAAMGSTANDLVVAVCRAGGIGTVGAPLLAPGRLDEALDDVLARTDGAAGVVAVNFIIPFLDLEAHGPALDIAARRARIVEFFWGQPDPALVERVHAGGALAIWQTGSATEAEQAAEAGCDAVIAQAVEAGGHVRGTVALLPLLAEVVERVAIPVLAAGGISTPRALAGALAAGASGARLGTRFAATREAPFHPRYQAALVEAEAEEAVHSEAFSVFWDAAHRVLQRSIDRASAGSDPFVGRTTLAGEEIDVQRWTGLVPTADSTGDIEAMPMFAGQGVGAVRAVEPAGEIVERLAGGAATVLAKIRHRDEAVELPAPDPAPASVNPGGTP